MKYIRIYNSWKIEIPNIQKQNNENVSEILGCEWFYGLNCSCCILKNKILKNNRKNNWSNLKQKWWEKQ